MDDVGVILQACVGKNWRNKGVGKSLMMENVRRSKQEFRFMVSSSNIKNYGSIVWESKTGYLIVGNYS